MRPFAGFGFEEHSREGTPGAAFGAQGSELAEAGRRGENRGHRTSSPKPGTGAESFSLATLGICAPSFFIVGS